MPRPKPPEGWTPKTVTLSGEGIEAIWSIASAMTLNPGQVIDRLVKHSLGEWMPESNIDNLPEEVLSAIVETDAAEQEDLAEETAYSEEDLANLCARSKVMIDRHFNSQPIGFFRVLEKFCKDDETIPEGLKKPSRYWEHQKWLKAGTVPKEYAAWINTILLVLEGVPKTPPSHP